ncbi:MAG TPA: helix-turn-helix domain-containing protein [Rhizomicrobium sp.]|nr:helix-turn-helix domain-containing protein [Rhizomicrobium sp.]
MISVKTRPPEIRARPFDGERDPASRIENLLSRQEQEEFRKIATVLEYSRGGHTVFAEGEDAHFVYSVATGVVRISRHSDGGRRQVLALMLPGDLFGLPDAGAYANCAEVTCPTTLFRVPWAELRGLMAREPAMQLSMLNRVAYDLREAQRRILILGQQNTVQRLASLLVDFALHPAFYDAVASEIVLPLTRVDIADYLGTSAETVARGFARLERDGLVKRSGPRQVRIFDIRGLQQLQTRKRRTDA